MTLEWTQAQTRTEWGADMVVANVAVTKDSTLTLYCEKQDIERVNAMLRDVEEPV